MLLRDLENCMNDITLELKRDIHTSLDSVLSLSRFNGELKNVFFCKCIIKPKFEWINGAMFSLLSAILRQRIEENGISVSFDFSETKPSIKDLFLKNGFFEYNSVVDPYNTIVPVKSFERTEIENFIEYIKTNFNVGKFPFPADFTGKIENCLAEIFSNCELHSQTRKVFSAGQYFPNKGKRGEFAFCLTDIGVGMTKLVKSKISTITTSEEAIRWAFTKNNTTIVDRPGGLGLNSLKEMVKNYTGSLIVVANDIVFDVLQNRSEKLPFDFDGTSIILTLTC